MHAARDSHAAESSLPSHGIRLAAGGRRERIRRLGALPNDPGDGLLSVDEGLAHNPLRIGRGNRQCKPVNAAASQSRISGNDALQKLMQQFR